MGNRPQIQQSSRVACSRRKTKPPVFSSGFPVPLLLYTCILGPHFPDWLLLQVSSRVVTEGKPLALRCHGWKNKLIYKMLFYHNGKTFKFSPWNPEFTILKTNMSHNGIYHCSGLYGRPRFTSAGVNITVQGIVSE